VVAQKTHRRAALKQQLQSVPPVSSGCGKTAVHEPDECF
jgi:hypothetical protein